MRESMNVILTLAAVTAAYWLPFFHLRRWRGVTSLEAAILTPAASSLLFGGVAFFTHAAGGDPRLARATALFVLALSVVPQMLGRRGAAEASYRRPLLFSFLFLGLVLLFQAVSPIYIGGSWYFDWWRHYSLSQMYMGKVPHDYLWLGMYNFASRTPLLNLNAAFFLSSFGDRFWVYQIVATILNAVFVLPAYALSSRLAGRRTAMLIMAALFFSPSLLHNAWYPWPKLFAAYFVLAAAYFHIVSCEKNRLPDMRTSLLVFLLIWAGFFADQSSLFSSVVILAHMFWVVFRRAPAKLIPLGAGCAACFFALNGAWFAWSSSLLGASGTLLSYYQRPADAGGLSGYIILFTYHILTSICSPLFLYDIAGKQLDYLRFLMNAQALYYNSIAGFATVSLFAAALLAIGKGAGGGRQARFLTGKTVRVSLLVLAAWCALAAGLTLVNEAFGRALFSRYFNHPEFARKMFVSYFAVFAAAIFLAFVLLRLRAKNRVGVVEDAQADKAVWLLYWMAAIGYVGGIAAVHEIYIHGTVSAGSAVAVVLTILFLGRVAAGFPRWAKLLLTVPILLETS